MIAPEDADVPVQLHSRSMAERPVRDSSAPPQAIRRPVARSQARPRRVSESPADGRRLVAAVASSFVPGAGQAFNGRMRAALVFGGPTIGLAVAALLFLRSDRPAMLLAHVIAPPVLAALLALDVVVLGWRLVALLHAFVDRRYARRPGPVGAIGLAILLIVTVAPHALAWSYGTAAQAMFGQIFSESDARSNPAAPPPTAKERLNVLLIGVDSGPGRTEALTDSMIVVSLDPVGRTVSMLSIPRDLANVPLADGNVFGPKLNSLISFARRNPTTFQGGANRALMDAIGTMLGIPIPYYATVNLHGFVGMVDAVGGVDIDVRRPLSDPNYGGFGVGPGWSIEPGTHHLDGANALAYARIRKSIGESDFTRAARQQEVLVALRNQAVGAGLLLALPKLFAAVGDTVHTNLPPDRLPELAALAEQIDEASTVKLVLGAPFIKSGGSTQYGSVFVPVLSRIRTMANVVFGPPGGDPTWPVPGARASSGTGNSAAPRRSTAP
jgi:polyisoprenyl-teichoic acid--peptidoglycan teichoic acid transferase